MLFLAFDITMDLLYALSLIYLNAFVQFSYIIQD